MPICNQAHALNQLVDIKSENTTINVQERVSLLHEILYSTTMLFNYNKLSVVID